MRSSWLVIAAVEEEILAVVWNFDSRLGLGEVATGRTQVQHGIESPCSIRFNKKQEWAETHLRLGGTYLPNPNRS